MKILIISGEYPPMKGGVGRYTLNLVDSLTQQDNAEVIVAVGDSAIRQDNANENYLHSPVQHLKINSDDIDTTTDTFNNTHNKIYYGIIKKGDKKNSDRLLDLVSRVKPDIVNIQYERGLYENDTNITHLIERFFYGSTLHKFFKQTTVPVISTLHTVMPANEYAEYIRERAGRKEGRFAFLPRPLRFAIRKWALQRRYKLLFEIVNLSSSIISPAHTIKDIVKSGTVIYHGAEPYPSTSSKYSKQYRQELGLPIDRKLLLAFGYVGSYKGFDVLNDIQLPHNWSLVIKQNKHERGKEKPIQVKNAINLHLGHIDDSMLSKLFFSCDAIIFPYRLVSVSGVMFDALAHGLPFVASDLEFFKEFSKKGLGITCSRNSEAFSHALEQLEVDYHVYKDKINHFNALLKWDSIAQQHLDFFQQQIKSIPI